LPRMDTKSRTVASMHVHCFENKNWNKLLCTSISKACIRASNWEGCSPHVSLS
jgi:hypothetical protein